MSGATRYTKDPKELLIAKTAANVIEAAGYLYDASPCRWAPAARPWLPPGSCARR